MREPSTPGNPVTPAELLHVESHGTGRPVLLIHGFGGSLYTWRHLVPMLARDHEVVAVDLKGAGRARKPADGRYSVGDHADCIAALIEQRDWRDLTIVGHSFGGGVALAAIVGARLEGRLRNLVLIDSMAYRQAFPWFIRAMRVPILGPLSVFLLPKALQVRFVLRSAYHRPARITGDAVETYAAPLRQPDGRRALIEMARAPASGCRCAGGAISRHRAAGAHRMGAPRSHRPAVHRPTTAPRDPVVAARRGRRCRASPARGDAGRSARGAGPVPGRAARRLTSRDAAHRARRPRRPPHIVSPGPGTKSRDREREDGEFSAGRRGDRPLARRARGLRAHLRPPRPHRAPLPGPPSRRRDRG